MSSFAGVSVIADGELLRSPTAPTAPCETGASGYHLLVVQGHSRSRTRSVIESCYFTVGGHRWRIFYCPIWFGSMSFHLRLAEGTTGRPPVKAQFEFSFVDEIGKQEPARIHASKVLEFRGWLDSWDSAHVKFFQREALENHLKNDSFTVRCDVVVVNHATGVPVIDVLVPPSDMLQNLTDLFLSGEGTDVVFRVGGEMASAHRCVLAARSSVFRALLFSPMKQITSSSTSAVIDIDNMDATVFKAMLGFIYGDSVQVPDVEDDGALLDQLLVAADMYDLPRLKAICTKKLRDLRKMQVFVAVPRLCRAPVALEASRDDTVASVKARLHDMEGIPPHRQRLVFAGSALPDDDGMTLADHGVYDSSTIQLVETNMQIFVQSFKHVTFSGIASSDTVESFRVRFQEREGCPPAQQRFRYGTKQLEDGHTLAEYGVRDCTTLQFSCRPAYRRSRMVELYIDVRDTVGRIKERLEEAEGIPTECQKVFFRGEELVDGRALADSDALERGSPVVVEYQRRWSKNEDATKTEAERKTYGGVRKQLKKELPVATAEEIPAMQRRRFTVFLIDMGPEK